MPDIIDELFRRRIVWGLTVRGIVKASLLAALSVLFLFSFFSRGVASAANIKDIAGHWAVVEIQKAIATGYVKGYPDGRFKPDAGVTRAEFVAMVVSAFQVANEQDQHTLKDVRQQDWFDESVKSALAAGFVSGYPDGTFKPQKAVNRQEAACLLAKLLKLNGEGNLRFSDTSQIDNWAKPSVSSLIAKEIMAGYPDKTFRPKKTITRAEAVVIINNALASQFTPVTDQLQVTDNTVNVRSGPGTNTSKIGQVHSGDILQARAKSHNGWYQIDWQGQTGWISGDCVQIYQPSTPANPPASQSTLSVQVKQDNTGTTVDITGAQGSYQCKDETNPQRLLVTVSGAAYAATPLEIDIGQGGLDKIVTRLTGTTPVTAEVEIFFTALPAPLVYHTTQGASGEFLITLPPQIYQIQAVPISDFVAIKLSGTAPLNPQASKSTGSSPQFIFDFTGFTLSSSLQSWQQQLNTMGVTAIKLSQYRTGTVRLVVQVAPDVFYTSGTDAGGTQFILWLQQPAAKKALLGKPADNNLYYGIDASPYPGDAAMQAWWNNSPFFYTGFYLGPAPYHPDASFMYQRQVLVNQGWGLLPIYVGRQADSQHLDPQTGISDADDAVTLAVYAGFPSNTAIYLDIETPHPLTGSYMNYVTAWNREVQSRGYGVGMYCNAVNANQIRSALAGNVYVWAAHYTENNLPSSALIPADSGTPLADVWQFSGDSNLAYGGYPLSIDLNVSKHPDPSMPSKQTTGK
ncbi:MAG: S-layer homology domain-containing protein [Thermacetogeniaceae bacterium]